ncbi:anti-anti-sigma factor [Catenulispora sp. EB89]|uniref:STAS domain-containing protein n=1 Tax=Catenulispora sp. EB89 TaxID=3156257 RepID=UPI003517E511
MDFSTSTRHDDGRVVLTVAGDVDLAAHARFQADLDQAWDGSTDLVIDCSQVDFLDSMGLRVLVHARQRAVDNGRDLVVAAPSEPVLRVLELAGVAELFSVKGPVAED